MQPHKKAESFLEATTTFDEDERSPPPGDRHTRTLDYNSPDPNHPRDDAFHGVAAKPKQGLSRPGRTRFTPHPSLVPHKMEIRQELWQLPIWTTAMSVPHATHLRAYDKRHVDLLTQQVDDAMTQAWPDIVRAVEDNAAEPLRSLKKETEELKLSLREGRLQLREKRERTMALRRMFTNSTTALENGLRRAAEAVAHHVTLTQTCSTPDVPTTIHDPPPARGDPP